MKLQIQNGAPLRTARGARVCKADEFVIDPLTHDVSHVAVEGRLLSTHQVVAPPSARVGAIAGVVATGLGRVTHLVVAWSDLPRPRARSDARELSGG